MLKRMRFMLCFMLSVVCCVVFIQSALALVGQVEKVKIDLEQSYDDVSADTVLNQKMSNSGDILLAQNCAEVCGPSPTKSCDQWAKNHCCECCEPLPSHCGKCNKWKDWCKDRKKVRDDRWDNKNTDASNNTNADCDKNTINSGLSTNTTDGVWNNGNKNDNLSNDADNDWNKYNKSNHNTNNNWNKGTVNTGWGNNNSNIDWSKNYKSNTWSHDNKNTDCTENSTNSNCIKKEVTKNQ